MVIETEKIEALVEQLSERWSGIRTQDQLRAIMRAEQYQMLQEKAINVYGLSEVEAWNKAITANVHLSR